GGQSVTVALTTAPTDFTVDAGTSWSVAPVLGGSGANERWATNETVSGVAMKSESLTFHYSHQFSASFAYLVTGGSGFVAPSVNYEQFALARSDRANLTVWVDAGSAYSFPSSLVGSNASERWRADAPNPNGTVVGSGVIEVAYRHQALLTFGFQGPAESSISPASGWFDVGPSPATAHFSLSASAALAFYSSIAAVGIIIALVLLAAAVRRGRRRPEPPPPPPLEPPLPPPPPP